MSEPTSPRRRAFDQWKVANPWIRLASQLIDQALVLSAILLFLTFLFREKSWTAQWIILVAVLWPMATFVYQCVMIYFTGTTLGKKAFAMQIQNANPDAPLSAWQILARQSIWWLGALSIGAGWSTILSRSDRRAWHDIVSETIVIDVEKIHVSSPAGLTEKAIGHSWAALVSMVFFSVLSLLIFFQFQKLDRSHFTNLVTLQDESWLILIDQFDPHFIKSSSIDEEKMAAQLAYFAQAKKLPVSDRFHFYKTRMLSNENFLCRKQYAESEFCQTSQLLGALLSEMQTKVGKTGKALEVIQLLYKAEVSVGDNHYQLQLDVLERALNTMSPNTVAYMALKTHLIRKLCKRGEFEQAANLVSSEMTQETHANPLAPIIQDQLTEVSCQATAFHKCNTADVSYCGQNPFWKNWNQGCENSKNPKLTTNAAKLAWVWKKIKSDKFSKNQWNGFKKDISPSSGFESQIFTAMDFYVASQEEKPVTLLEKSKFLDNENPLWGWAHSPAIRRYGAQWLSLISTREQNNAESLGMMPDQLSGDHNKDDIRGIASEK